mmetsp:Transcript_2171/g.5874  ORF Transcript_2171/g.5874 Transcript_2171/m.5874 type:complete len:354 (-) Transcript_2171:1370-2431(-)
MVGNDPARILRPLMRTSSRALRTDSTQLRTNVADQVQRDLTPAGRLLSMVLVLVEMLAEFAVLFVDRGKPCDAPLRGWLLVLIALQGGTVVLNALAFVLSNSSRLREASIILASRQSNLENGETGSQQSRGARRAFAAGAQHASSRGQTARNFQEDSSSLLRSSSWASIGGDGENPVEREETAFSARRADAVLRAVHTLNAAYLAWFVLGSIWVSDAGACPKTAPNLYRLVLALTVIYYALLGLPLACFCLIMCCLPLFIRLMLPYAERAHRRGRAASAQQISALDSNEFCDETFAGVGDRSCVICLSNYTSGELVSTLPCNHHFHKKCIEEWLAVDKSCPLCKQDIDNSPNV